MLIPIFPKLNLVDPELANRVEGLFDEARKGKVPESVMPTFMNRMLHAIFEGVIENPRVKGTFETKLPPLIGKRLCLHAKGLSPWIIEVVPAPNVLDIKLSTEEETNKLPGFIGDPDVIKKIITDSASVDMLADAIFEKRLDVINASPSNPAVWIRDLFLIIGPVWDRSDLMEKMIHEMMPTINDELLKWKC
jgi:hypothetical protein